MTSPFFKKAFRKNKNDRVTLICGTQTAYIRARLERDSKTETSISRSVKLTDLN
jgi:hypothetical protein